MKYYNWYKSTFCSEPFGIKATIIRLISYFIMANTGYVIGLLIRHLIF